MVDACEVPSFDQWLSEVKSDLHKKGQLDEIYKVITSHKTDDERVRSLLLVDTVKEHLDRLDKHNSSSGKCRDESIYHRNQGNILYQKGKYRAALEKYNASITLAPSFNDMLCDQRDISLALANRSAVLFKLKYFSLCLKDIELALDYGYPSNLQYKLFDRKGKCLSELGLYKEACICLERSGTLLHDAKMDKEKKSSWLTGLGHELERCALMCSKSSKNINRFESNSRQEADIKSTGDMPELLGRNPSFSSLSSACDVLYTADRGRHVVATRDVEPGEVLAIEAPYAAVLLPAYCGTHCHHCLSRLLVSVPCHQCTFVQFCGPACRDKALSSYHQYECRILPMLQDINVDQFGHLALRIITESGLDMMREYNMSYGDASHDGKAAVPGLATGYSAIHSLETHGKDRGGEDLLERALLAVLLLALLRRHSTFFGELSDNHSAPCREHTTSQDAMMPIIGGLILRYLQMLPCNAHEVSEFGLKPEAVITSVPSGIGAGIYAVHSLFNHSCDPDVTRNSYGTTLVSRAIKLIKKGDEILDNYGALYAIHPKAVRDTLLERQYFFQCHCEACENDWPLYQDPVCYAPRYWKCESCQSSLPNDLTTDLATCLTCTTTQSMRAKLDKLKRSGAGYLKAMKCLVGGKAHDAVPALTLHIKTMDELVFPPWRDYVMCQEALKQCYSILGNCHTVTM